MKINKTYYPYANKQTFKGNEGFIEELKIFKNTIDKKTPNADITERLIAHAKVATITSEFLKKIESITGENKEIFNLIKRILKIKS